MLLHLYTVTLWTDADEPRKVRGVVAMDCQAAAIYAIKTAGLSSNDIADIEVHSEGMSYVF